MDKYDEKALRVLPCHSSCNLDPERIWHSARCPLEFRAAVATLLREAEAQGAEGVGEWLRKENDDLRAEVAKLQAGFKLRGEALESQKLAAEQFAKDMTAEIAKLAAERDAARQRIVKLETQACSSSVIEECMVEFGTTQLMNCRKKKGHKTPWHSCHNDCGAQNAEHVVCGFDDEHKGPHSWEISELRAEVAAANKDHCACIFKDNFKDRVCIEACKYHSEQHDADFVQGLELARDIGQKLLITNRNQLAWVFTALFNGAIQTEINKRKGEQNE